MCILCKKEIALVYTKERVKTMNKKRNSKKLHGNKNNPTKREATLTVMTGNWYQGSSSLTFLKETIAKLIRKYFC